MSYQCCQVGGYDMKPQRPPRLFIVLLHIVVCDDIVNKFPFLLLVGHPGPLSLAIPPCSEAHSAWPSLPAVCHPGPLSLAIPHCSEAHSAWPSLTAVRPTQPGHPSLQCIITDTWLVQIAGVELERSELMERLSTAELTLSSVRQQLTDTQAEVFLLCIFHVPTVILSCPSQT